MHRTLLAEGSGLESPSGDDPAGCSNEDLPRADNRSVDFGRKLNGRFRADIRQEFSAAEI